MKKCAKKEMEETERLKQIPDSKDTSSKGETTDFLMSNQKIDLIQSSQLFRRVKLSAYYIIAKQ